MPRRSKFAEAAETWMRRHASGRSVSTEELWQGLSKEHAELTTPNERRKTPRTTCMRDLRLDPRFKIGDRKVSLV